MHILELYTAALIFLNNRLDSFHTVPWWASSLEFLKQDFKVIVVRVPWTQTIFFKSHKIFCHVCFNILLILLHFLTKNLWGFGVLGFSSHHIFRGKYIVANSLHFWAHDPCCRMPLHFSVQVVIIYYLFIYTF